MTLKNPSANCFRKFKGLQLTFQVVKKNRGRPSKQVVPRCPAERTFAWFQKKYRRVVVRWERITACFDAFLAIATIHIWMQRLLVG